MTRRSTKGGQCGPRRIVTRSPVGDRAVRVADGNLVMVRSGLTHSPGDGPSRSRFLTAPPGRVLAREGHRGVAGVDYGTQIWASGTMRFPAQREVRCSLPRVYLPATAGRPPHT